MENNQRLIKRHKIARKLLKYYDIDKSIMYGILQNFRDDNQSNFVDPPVSFPTKGRLYDCIVNWLIHVNDGTLDILLEL